MYDFLFFIFYVGAGECSSGTTAGKVKYFPETLKAFDSREFLARILKSLAYK